MYSSWLNKLVGHNVANLCTNSNRISSKFDFNTGLGLAFTVLSVRNVLWLDSEKVGRVRRRADRKAGRADTPPHLTVRSRHCKRENETCDLYFRLHFFF